MQATALKPTLNEEERAAARALLLTLKSFRDVSPNMPLSYVLAFLTVAAEEGHSVAEYADKMGISPTVMTRNLLKIGDLNRKKEDGLGLITSERDAFDLRKYNARVTVEGRTLMQTAMSALKAYCKAMDGADPTPIGERGGTGD